MILLLLLQEHLLLIACGGRFGGYEEVLGVLLELEHLLLLGGALGGELVLHQEGGVVQLDVRGFVQEQGGELRLREQVWYLHVDVALVLVVVLADKHDLLISLIFIGISLPLMSSGDLSIALTV